MLWEKSDFLCGLAIRSGVCFPAVMVAVIAAAALATLIILIHKLVFDC